jgi:Bacterial membrane protein YfhO
MLRLQPYASSWGLDLRDLVLIAALAIVAILPVSHDIERASKPGPFARVAMSWETVNHRALDERTLPLWNPYQFGGRPHLANPEMLSLYPPHMLLRLLPLPLFVAVSFALHTWLAAVGTYLVARMLRVSRLAALAASGATLCGRLFISFEDIAYSLDVFRLAWLPLIAACALRSAERPTWLPRPELVVVVTLGLIASALNPTYLVATVIASYAFAALWQSPAGSWSQHVVAQPVILACVAAGLSAVQIVPTVRFWSTMQGANDVIPDVSPRTLEDGGSTQQHPEILDALRSLGGRGRVLSTCDRAIDGSDVVALGAPGVGGYGGVFLADYARFSTLVRGPAEPMRAVFQGIPEAASGPARADLLNLLGVEYLVACTSPNPQRWALVKESRGVGVYRSLVPSPRAFWTCAPVEAGRQEVEHRLRETSYDSHFVLQPHTIVHVRWPEGINDADRARAESELHLAPHRDIGDRTWQYNLLDRSPENVVAILAHPLVEDTQGIDRTTHVLKVSAPPTRTFEAPKSDWLLGVEPCDAPVPATILVQDRTDGRMIVDVNAPRDGVVFFSETYYPDRRAWVDGKRSPRMKANLAFTAVRVPAGTHRIELRYDVRALWAGAALSAVSLLVWLLIERRVPVASSR